MGYFDIAGSPDTPNKLNLKNFITHFPSCNEIVHEIKKIIGNTIEGKSVLVRAVDHENIYKSVSLFIHEGNSIINVFDTDNRDIKQYNYDIKASEYWLFDTEERIFKIFKLIRGRYKLEALTYLALCDGKDSIKYFPYAFSIGSVEDNVSHILTNGEIDSMIFDIFGYQEDPFSEILDGKEYLRHFSNVNYSIVSNNILMSFMNSNGINERLYEFLPHLGVYFSDNDIVVPSFSLFDESKVTEYYIDGAPELIIEISIKNNKEINEVYKVKLYEKYRVKEYWIVDLEDKTICTYLLKDDQYESRIYKENEVIHVSVLPECEIVLSKVFEDLYSE